MATAESTETAALSSLRWSALGGLVTWFLLWLIRGAPRDPMEHTLLFVPLVLYPLSMALVSARSRTEVTLARAIVLLQPVSAVAVLAALWMRASLLAGALAAPWLATTAIGAVLGVTHSIRDRSRAGDRLVAAGLVGLPLGPMWLLLARLDLRLFELDALAVFTSATHFHYITLPTALVCAQALRRLPDRDRAQFLDRVLVRGLILSWTLTTLGVGNAPASLIGAATLCAVVVTCAGMLAVGLPRAPDPIARGLLAAAGVLGLAAITPAAIWGWSELVHEGPVFVSLRVMLWLHGMGLAYGFAGCGLLASTVDALRARRSG